MNVQLRGNGNRTPLSKDATLERRRLDAAKAPGMVSGAVPGEERDPAAGAQSILRAISLLELFIEQRTELTVADAAASLEISRSSAHRLLTVLKYRGYIRQERRGGKYALGPRVVALAAAYRSSQPLSKVAIPHMQALLAKLNETVGLYVRQNDSARVLIERLESTHPIQVVMAAGEPMPLGIGATGRLLGMSDAAARAAGTVITHGERVPNARAVAAPIFDHEGKLVAAIDVCGPISRFPMTAVRQYAKDVRATAEAISRALGDPGVAPKA